MNEMTLFIAQLAGPTFLALGLGMFISGKYYSDMMKQLDDQKFTMMISSMIMIPLGIVMLMKHNLWGSPAEIIVSILGLALLVKGILMGMFPKFFYGLTDSIVSPSIMRFGAAVWVIGGAYLTYVAYFL